MCFKKWFKSWSHFYRTCLLSSLPVCQLTTTQFRIDRQEIKKKVLGRQSKSQFLFWQDFHGSDRSFAEALRHFQLTVEIGMRALIMLADLESVGFSLCSRATAGTGRRALFISCVCVSSIHEHAVHHFVWCPWNTITQYVLNIFCLNAYIWLLPLASLHEQQGIYLMSLYRRVKHWSPFRAQRNRRIETHPATVLRLFASDACVDFTNKPGLARVFTWHPSGLYIPWTQTTLIWVKWRQGRKQRKKRACVCLCRW